MNTDPSYPLQLDQRDELAGFRERFVIADQTIYLDGNSLGRLPVQTAALLQQVVNEGWGARLVRGWNDGWFRAAQRIGGKIARLIGADPDEVIVADSTSVNLFKLVAACLMARPDRPNVVSDVLNFPSDLYVIEGALRCLRAAGRLDLIRSDDSITVNHASLDSAINSKTALVALAHTSFKSGFTYDLAAVTELVHQRGALMLWDFCHSVGVIPIDVHAARVDVAVGCTYKYLNGGPGAPAFLFVKRELHRELMNPIWGWFGRRMPFEFALNYEPAAGIEQFLVGTPPVLSLLAIEPGIDLVLEAGVDRVRAKSIDQTEYAITLWHELLRPLGVALKSPTDPNRRGSHIALSHGEGLRIARALIEQQQVIPDFRPPDNLRFGIAPLYTSFQEIHAAMDRLRHVIEHRQYEQYSSDHHGGVT